MGALLNVICAGRVVEARQFTGCTVQTHTHIRQTWRAGRSLLSRVQVPRKRGAQHRQYKYTGIGSWNPRRGGWEYQGLRVAERPQLPTLQGGCTWAVPHQ